MKTILALGIFWIGYGIAGLFGLQVIPEKYKGKDWTKSYIRYRGISWIMIGIPWLILYMIIRDRNLGTFIMSFLLIVCAIPSLVCSIADERKYKAML